MAKRRSAARRQGRADRTAPRPAAPMCMPLVRWMLGLVLGAVAAQPPDAVALCLEPPPEARLHHTVLIARAPRIVLAEAIGHDWTPIRGMSRAVAYDFRVIETLRGAPHERIVLRGGAPPLPPAMPAQDFDAHRTAAFWNGGGREALWPDCGFSPRFVIGRRYLLFPGSAGHVNGFEEIASPDDLWLAAVRLLARTDGIARPKAVVPRMDPVAWLRRQGAVYLARAEICGDRFSDRRLSEVTPIVAGSGPPPVPGDLERRLWRRAWLACTAEGRARAVLIVRGRIGDPVRAVLADDEARFDLGLLDPDGFGVRADIGLNDVRALSR